MGVVPAEQGWFPVTNRMFDEYLPKIGQTAFLVYCSILRHADQEGVAYPSYSLLQRELNTGRLQIAAAIKRIREAGLVTVTVGRRSANVYHLVSVPTSIAAELVSQEYQSQSDTSTSIAAELVLVSQRDSNNTQGTIPKEQDTTPSDDADASSSPPPGDYDAKPERKRGTRIPPDFAITDDLYDYAASKGVSRAEAEDETEGFKLYWEAESGKHATKLDWNMTWKNRIRDQVNRGLIGPKRRSKNGQYLNVQQQTQNAIGRYAARIEANGTSGNEPRPTQRARLTDRGVSLDNGRSGDGGLGALPRGR